MRLKKQNMDENSLIKQVLSGNTAAFASIIDRHKDGVFSLAIRLLGNREDAEEITQDVFLKIYNSLGSFKQSSKLSTWIYRIAYNAAISKLRSVGKYKNEVAVEDYSVAETCDLVGVLEPLKREEQKHFLAKALQQLKAEERLLVEFFYLEEMKVEEIVEVTGESKANIKVKLHRVRKKMHQILVEELNSEVQTLY